MIVRTDCGTENGIIAATQCYFRAAGNDAFAGDKSHVYGSSHANQRIEGWWSFLRRHRTSWWIDYFKDMVTSNLLNIGNEFHMECLWFCYAHIIQADLDDVVEHWNSHYIRKSRHGTISGIPDILYSLPHYHGKTDCLFPVSSAQVEAMETNCQLDEQVENIYQEYFETVLTEIELEVPSNEEEALNLFQILINLQD